MQSNYIFNKIGQLSTAHFVVIPSSCIAIKGFNLADNTIWRGVHCEAKEVGIDFKHLVLLFLVCFALLAIFILGGVGLAQLSRGDGWCRSPNTVL